MEESCGLTTTEESSSDEETNLKAPIKFNLKQMTSYAKTLNKDTEQPKSFSQVAKGREIHVNMQDLEKIQQEV